MPEGSIDKLSIEITSTAGSATKNIDALANSLQNLVTKTGGTVTRLEQISASITQLKNAASGFNFSAFERLSTFKLSKTTVNNLTNLANVVRTFPTAGTSQIRNLGEAFMSLSNLSTLKLGPAINQLKKLPDVFKEYQNFNISGLVNQLKILNTELDHLAVNVNALAYAFKKMPASMRTAGAAARSVAASNKYLSTTTNTATKSISRMLTAVGGVSGAFYLVTRSISTCINEANTYIENMNLFTASMGEYAKEAQGYAQTVQDAMGIDAGEWMRNQGIFQTLATGMGVATDRAAVMSQQLTQLGYDISSFYNIRVDDAMLKLQSGLSGELEPLRRLGWDLSNARMQMELTSRGIDKNASEMTQAEKVALRYYLIMNQVTQVHGDMARTLESPANQLRVLQAQIRIAAREIGNLLIPALSAILPYVIGAVKALRILAQEVANFFGIDVNFEFDYSNLDTSGFNTGAENVEDFGDEVEDTNEKVNELKNSILGFDELNVLNGLPIDNKLDEVESFGIDDFPLDEYDFLEGLSDEIEKKTDEIAQKIIDALKRLLELAKLIAAALALWKLAPALLNALAALLRLLDRIHGRIRTINRTPIAPKVVPPPPVRVRTIPPAPVRVRALPPAPVVVRALPPAPVKVLALPPAPVVVRALPPAPVVVRALPPAPVVVRALPPAPVKVTALPPAPVVVTALPPAPVVVRALPPAPVPIKVQLPPTVRVKALPPAPVKVTAVPPAPVQVRALPPAPVKVKAIAPEVHVKALPPAPVKVKVIAPEPVKVTALPPAPVQVKAIAPEPVQVKALPPAPVEVPVTPPDPVEVKAVPPNPVQVEALPPDPVDVKVNEPDPVNVHVGQDPSPKSVDVDEPGPVNVKVNQPEPVNVPVNEPEPVNIPINQPGPVHVNTEVDDRPVQTLSDKIGEMQQRAQGIGQSIVQGFGGIEGIYTTLGTIVAGIAGMYTQCDSFREGVDKTIDKLVNADFSAISDHLAPVIGDLGTLLQSAQDIFKFNWGDAAFAVGAAIQAAMGNIPGAVLTAGVWAWTLEVRFLEWGADEVIEKVNVVGDVCKETADKLGVSVDSMEQAFEKITELNLSGKVVTSADAQEIAGNVNSIRDTILNNLDAQRNEELRGLQLLPEEAFAEADTSLEEMEQGVYNRYEGIKSGINNNVTALNDIYRTASDEHRSISEQEQESVMQVYDILNSLLIDNATTSKDEREKILDALANNETATAAETAVSVMQESMKTRDAAIEDAEKTETALNEIFSSMVKTGELSTEQAETLIAASSDTFGSLVQDAWDTYNEVERGVKEKAGPALQYIDETTGSIKTNVQEANEGLAELVNNPAFASAGASGGNLSYVPVKTDRQKMLEEKRKKLGKGAYVAAYASGGLPSSGDLFLARENGTPEYIGSFGGQQNAVANNEQIISGIQQGVTMAMLNVMSSQRGNEREQNIEIPIYLDRVELARGVYRGNLDLVRRGEITANYV